MSNASELLGLLRERRSVRRFRDAPVPRDVIERLVEAAAWAPSAGNRQGWLFTVVASPAVKQQMAEAVRRRWDAILAEKRESGFIQEIEGYVRRFTDFALAPVVIAVSARAPDSLQRHLLGDAAAATAGGTVSAAMAAQNLMLAAHALGLGTCCMTGALAASEDLVPLLGIGKKEELVCLIALGFPAETPSPPQRKPVTEITRFLE